MKNCFTISYILFIFVIGCSSSEKVANSNISSVSPETTVVELLQKELNDLRTENQSLKEQISKLEQYSRNATARVAELETQLTELKESPTFITPPPAVVSNDVKNNEIYERGLKLFKLRNYKDAAGIFYGIIDSGNSGDLEDNCYYWIGECTYALKKYKDAIVHLQKVFSFPNSEKTDDAQFMIANCYLAMGNKKKAKIEYQKLIDEYPESPYVKQSRIKSDNL